MRVVGTWHADVLERKGINSVLQWRSRGREGVVGWVEIGRLARGQWPMPTSGCRAVYLDSFPHVLCSRGAAG